MSLRSSSPNNNVIVVAKRDVFHMLTFASVCSCPITHRTRKLLLSFTRLVLSVVFSEPPFIRCQPTRNSVPIFILSHCCPYIKFQFFFERSLCYSCVPVSSTAPLSTTTAFTPTSSSATTGKKSLEIAKRQSHSHVH